MLEAHIVSPRGSLYYAGDALPYDLDTIREHVRDAIFGMYPADVRVEVIIDDESVEPRVAGWLRLLAATGVQVRLFFAHAPGAAGPEERADEPHPDYEPARVATA